jgi:hypothetical protein
VSTALALSLLRVQTQSWHMSVLSLVLAISDVHHIACSIRRIRTHRAHAAYHHPVLLQFGALRSRFNYSSNTVLVVRYKCERVNMEQVCILQDALRYQFSRTTSLVAT